MGTTTGSDAVTETISIDMTPSGSLVDCSCCGMRDEKDPCLDCQLYCTDEDWCKAGRVARVRLRLGRFLRWLAVRVGY